MEKNKHLGTMLVFVSVMIILFLKTKHISFIYWALVFAGIGLFIPSLSRKIDALWMKFAEALGAVMNKVILSIVFFVVLWPVAVLSRLFRKNPLKNKTQAQSYFTERNFTYTKKSFEELW